jgi:hypothetical protein
MKKIILILTLLCGASISAKMIPVKIMLNDYYNEAAEVLVDWKGGTASISGIHDYDCKFADAFIDTDHFKDKIEITYTIFEADFTCSGAYFPYIYDNNDRSIDNIKESFPLPAFWENISEAVLMFLRNKQKEVSAVLTFK